MAMPLTVTVLPTPTFLSEKVALVSLDVNLKNLAGVEQINAAMREAAEGELAGILDYNTEKLVSVDFNHSPASCTFDALSTMAIGDLVKVIGWYDNEWGYSNRLVDLVELVASKL